MFYNVERGDQKQIITEMDKFSLKLKNVYHEEFLGKYKLEKTNAWEHEEIKAKERPWLRRKKAIANHW